jgi:hypothetical protein
MFSAAVAPATSLHHSSAEQVERPQPQESRIPALLLAADGPKGFVSGRCNLPPLTTRYTRIALTQKLRRIVDEGVGYGLALEGISAADVARAK